MAGPYLWLREELGPAVERGLVATVGWPWSILVSRKSPVAGQENFPFWQGFRVRTEQGMGCVSAPAPTSH